MSEHDGVIAEPIVNHAADGAATTQPASGGGNGRGGGNGDEDSASRLTAVFNAVTGFMSLVGKEWLNALINQGADPPFSFNAAFPDGAVRIMRLVVMTAVLTGVVALSERFFSKNTPTLVLTMAIKVVIATFLAAMVYVLFAFVCGVRVYATPRSRLTLGQVFFSLLYIFVPWIPIFAFLWSFAKSGGQMRLLLLLLLFYLSLGYVFFNFSKAIRRLTCCPAYRVLLSVLLPLILAISYIFYRA